MKSLALKIVNTLMFIVFLGLSLSGILHESIDKELYETFHPLMGYILVGLVVVHLILNRDWIMKVLLKKKK